MGLWFGWVDCLFVCGTFIKDLLAFIDVSLCDFGMELEFLQIQLFEEHIINIEEIEHREGDEDNRKED